MLSEAQIFDTFWGKKEKKDELKLLKEQGGWFAILHLPPSKRTKMFANEFTEATRSTIRRYLDETQPTNYQNGTVKDWYPIKRGDVFDISGMDEEAKKKYLSKVSALIRGRQFCDTYNIPYSFACKFVINAFYFDKSYLRKFSTLPQPRLFSQKEIKENLLLSWADNVRTKIQFFNHESMIIGENPSKFALKHQDWVISQISLKQRPSISAQTFLDKGFVTKEALEKAGIEI